MDDPEREIEHVIQSLVSTPPSTQKLTIDTYFTQDAYFVHPFCRTPGRGPASIPIITGIYQWYKVMSPRIRLTVHGVAWDRANDMLYVNMSQVFQPFIVPLPGLAIDVSLVTVLKLEREPGRSAGRYLIAGQEDLYQTTEFLKFILPHVGAPVWFVWCLLSGVMCYVLAWLFWPVTYVHQTIATQRDEHAEKVTKERKDAEMRMMNNRLVKQRQKLTNGASTDASPQ